MKIFLVDDSRLVVQRIKDLVNDVPGIEFAGSADDVSEATRLILELRPSAVVLDLQLPHGTGIDVLQAVKAVCPQTVFIVCTNYPLSQYRRKCVEAGAEYFLDKSTEFDKLPAILGSLVKHVPVAASAKS